MFWSTHRHLVEPLHLRHTVQTLQQAAHLLQLLDLVSSQFAVVDRPDAVAIPVVAFAPPVFIDDAVDFVHPSELLVHLVDVLQDGDLRLNGQHVARQESLVHSLLQFLTRKLPPSAQTLVDDHLPHRVVLRICHIVLYI